MKIYIIVILFISLLGQIKISTAQEIQNGSINVTLRTSDITLDPGGIQDTQSLFVSRQIDCQLVRNQGGNFVLDAADSIKYITPKKIILTINKNAHFHDGSPVTSQDVLASFEYIKKRRNIFKNFYIWVDKIELSNAKTIIFHLTKHIPQLLKVLSSNNFTIYKKSFLENAVKDKEAWKFPLGCGGYKVSEFSKSHIKLTPINNGFPIVFHLNKSNEIHVNDIDQFDIVTLKLIGNPSSKKINFNVIEMLDPIQYYIGVNTRSKFWKNKFERCKFMSEFDTRPLLNELGRDIIPANDLYPKGTLGYSEQVDFKKDLSDIAKSGKVNELNVNRSEFCVSYFTISIQEKYIKHFLDDFKKSYPNIRVSPIRNTKNYGVQFLENKCDVLLFGLGSTYLDGYEFLTIFENNDGNFSGLQDKKLNSHILNSQIIESANERAEEYQKISNEIKESCFVRPIYTALTKKIYVKKNLNTPNIGLVPINQYYLGNVSIYYDK